MDKRTWPWKKKPTDKSSTSTDAEQSTLRQASSNSDDQVTTMLMLDLGRGSTVALPEGQSDEKIRLLSERLIAADHLVKQHVKVAEEAVSGWEKSKAEYVSLKHQLEAVMEQKQASDDRVSHLDEALKASVWQLRQLREEQEQRIHDAIVKRTREWEHSRLELQQRLANADHQLVEDGFQNSLLHKTIQEQAKVIVDLREAHAQAEAEVEALQARVETFEKENASLKYELMILSKELEIRNQERDINKKTLDAASRQRSESIRRINKLEAECQRLRTLVRKKLPGSGSMIQMKLEAEGLDGERGTLHNRSRPATPGGEVVSSPKATESTLNLEHCLSERLLTMEEETKMLKEALAKRNTELQAARLMCTQTSDRLLNLECQVGQTQNSPSKPLSGGYGLHGVEGCASLSSCRDPIHASASEYGNDDERSVADSWASALITELACFQKGRPHTTQELSKGDQHLHKVYDELDLIDDFLEVERLVSLPSQQQQAMELSKEKDPGAPKIRKQVPDTKEAELQAANLLCAELKNKLAAVEEQASSLFSKNAANELSLFSLQEKLNTILGTYDGLDTEKLVEDVRGAVVASHCSSVDGLQAHVMKLSKDSTPSTASDTTPSREATTSPPPISSPRECDSSCFNFKPELTPVISEVVHLVEDLMVESWKAQHLNPENCLSDSACCHPSNLLPLTQRPSEVHTVITSFQSTINLFLKGKVDLLQLMRELSSILRNISLTKAQHLSLIRRGEHKPEATKAVEEEVFSDAGSPFSTTSNCDGSEHSGAKVLSSSERLSNLKGPRVDEELRRIRAEKAALESHMKAEFSRMDKTEEMIAHLQQEKSQLSNRLEEEKEKAEAIKSQLLDVEQLVANLRVRLASTEMSRNVAEGQLSAITAENGKLSAQLQQSQADLGKMHEVLSSLKMNLDQEHARNEELQADLALLQEQVLRANSNLFQAEAGRSVDKTAKGEEMVDASWKLAECQRTILVLGKQIQNIASARGAVSDSFNSSSAFNSDEDRFMKDSFAHGNSSLNQLKQSIRSDPGNCGMSDVTDDELISAANGKAHVEGKGQSECSTGNSSTHEDYIQAVSEMPSSSDTEKDTKIVPYVMKAAPKKKGLLALANATDRSKSLNLEALSSSPRRGSSFSRFFSRNKK